MFNFYFLKPNKDVSVWPTFLPLYKQEPLNYTIQSPNNNSWPSGFKHTWLMRILLFCFFGDSSAPEGLIRYHLVLSDQNIARCVVFVLAFGHRETSKQHQLTERNNNNLANQPNSTPCLSSRIQLLDPNQPQLSEISLCNKIQNNIYQVTQLILHGGLSQCRWNVWCLTRLKLTL